jgi:hypothetical protein
MIKVGYELTIQSKIIYFALFYRLMVQDAGMGNIGSNPVGKANVVSG